MNFLTDFVQWSKQQLLESADGLEYLQGRGASKSQLHQHDVGFVTSPWVPDLSMDVMHSDKCDDSPICDSCKFTRWSSDKNGFKLVDRVVYPITTYSGRIVGVQTRSIKEKLYDTFMLSRRSEGQFFMAASAFPSVFSMKLVAIAEGPSDALVVERILGIPTLSVLTNSLNLNQSKAILRFADSIVCVLDEDAAGRDGVKRIVRDFGRLKQVVDVRYKDHGAKDPADLWLKHGDPKCKKILQDSLPPALRRL